mmetsp:Transcript_33961/g.96238  ORF Transcript_33961/g.96238 Transcript_33961/m.96238 type:complete len:254 (-) Transcript_33961:632-1393(-)
MWWLPCLRNAYRPAMSYRWGPAQRIFSLVCSTSPRKPAAAKQHEKLGGEPGTSMRCTSSGIRSPSTMWRAAVSALRVPFTLQATASVEPAGMWPSLSRAAAAARGPSPLLRRASTPLSTSPNRPSPPTTTRPSSASSSSSPSPSTSARACPAHCVNVRLTFTPALSNIGTHSEFHTCTARLLPPKGLIHTRTLRGRLLEASRFMRPLMALAQVATTSSAWCSSTNSSGCHSLEFFLPLWKVWTTRKLLFFLYT